MTENGEMMGELAFLTLSNGSFSGSPWERDYHVSGALCITSILQHLWEIVYSLCNLDDNSEAEGGLSYLVYIFMSRHRQLQSLD